MKKIVFLGSKEIGAFGLEYLVSNEKSLNAKVISVFTNPMISMNSPGNLAQFAQSKNIPVLDNLEDLLNLPEVDYIISVQYHEILHQKHISKARELAVNLHMAPLPEYRGCNQFSFAILDEATTFGTTLHVMETGIDSGDILFERRFPIPKDITVGELFRQTTVESKTLFVESIPLILSGKYSRTPQKTLYALRPHHFHLRDEVNHIKQIDVSWSEEKIDRHIRATYFPPFPPPYCLVDGKKIELSPNWRSEIQR